MSTEITRNKYVDTYEQKRMAGQVGFELLLDHHSSRSTLDLRETLSLA